MTFLYDADAERGAEWAALFAERAPEIAFHYCADAVDPRSVKYLGVWHPPTDISAKYPNLEVLFSLGAGVDQFDFDVLPAELPVVRMIEPGISDAMGGTARCARPSCRRTSIGVVGKMRAGALLARGSHPTGFALSTVGRGNATCSGGTS